jgi:hypothetical protein
MLFLKNIHFFYFFKYFESIKLTLHCRSAGIARERGSPIHPSRAKSILPSAAASNLPPSASCSLAPMSKPLPLARSTCCSVASIPPLPAQQLHQDVPKDLHARRRDELDFNKFGCSKKLAFASMQPPPTKPR